MLQTSLQVLNLIFSYLEYLFSCSISCLLFSKQYPIYYDQLLFNMSLLDKVSFLYAIQILSQYLFLKTMGFCLRVLSFEFLDWNSTLKVNQFQIPNQPHQMLLSFSIFSRCIHLCLYQILLASLYCLDTNNEFISYFHLQFDSLLALHRNFFIP